MTREKELRQELWEIVNWECQDVHISDVLGVPREAVRLWRRKLNKPDSSEKHRQVSGAYHRFFEWVKAHPEFVASHTIREVIRESQIRIHYGSAVLAAKQTGLPYVVPTRGESARLIDWMKINWRLPNGVIAEAWGVKPMYIMQRRCQLARGPSTLVAGTTECSDALNLERAKAFALEAVERKVMTNQEHQNEMNKQAERYIEQLSQQDEVIASLKYSLAQWNMVASSLKFLMQQVNEAKELSP